VVLGEELEGELEDIEARVPTERKCREQETRDTESKEGEVKQGLNIGNEEVRSWLTELNNILSELLMGYYMLLKENEKLKRKNRDIQRIDEQT